VPHQGREAECGTLRPDQSDAERHAFENLIGMCRKQHKIIDAEKENYPVERLLEMKRTHEASGSRRYVISDELVQRLGETLAAEAEDRPLAPAAKTDIGGVVTGPNNTRAVGEMTETFPSFTSA
jgi:hypothetical protein